MLSVNSAQCGYNVETFYKYLSNRFDVESKAMEFIEQSIESSLAIATPSVVVVLYVSGYSHPQCSGGTVCVWL